MNEIVIDATNALLGRLSSFCAKKALQGHNVIVLNCDKAVIAGRPRATIQEYQVKRARGGSAQKGPYFPKQPQRIVKRTIRGMLPYKLGRGGAALDRIRCYDDVPEEYTNVSKIKAGKEKNIKTMSLRELANEI